MPYGRPSRAIDLVSPVMACLVAVYGAEFGRGDVRGDRAVVDDSAARRRLALHHRDRSLRTQERAGEIDVDHSLPLLECQLVERAPAARRRRRC